MEQKMDNVLKEIRNTCTNNHNQCKNHIYIVKAQCVCAKENNIAESRNLKKLTKENSAKPKFPINRDTNKNTNTNTSHVLNNVADKSSESSDTRLHQDLKSAIG